MLPHLLSSSCRRGVGEQRVGDRAEGHDDDVAGQLELAARRSAPAGGGRRRPARPAPCFCSLTARTQPCSSPRISSGATQEVELDALFLGVGDLFDAGRHLGARAAVGADGAARRPGAWRCARRPWPRCRRRRPPRVSPRAIGVPPSYVHLGAHQVDAGEVLVGRVDALEVLAGDVQEHRQAGAVGDEDGVEVAG